MKLHIVWSWIRFNSDSLGLLTLKADGRRRVHGARPGLGASQCPGGVPVVSRCKVVPRWCLGCVLVVSWYRGGVPEVSRLCLCWFLVVCWWYLGGVLVVSQLCLGGVLVVSWLCLGGVLVAEVSKK